MDKNGKVTLIKYRQLDKDPEIKKVTNEMEKLILGEKGIGLMDALGLSPGKIQKHLDDQFDEDLKELLEEHKDFIFWESRKRSAKIVQEWIGSLKDEVSQEELSNKMTENLKESEIEVIQELVNQHLK